MLWKMEVFNGRGERIALLTDIESPVNPRVKVESYFLWYYENIVTSGMRVSIRRQAKNSKEWEEMTIVDRTESVSTGS